MKGLLIIMSLFILISCKKDDKETVKVSSDIVGKWKLVEVYADPGDGSGKFRPIESNKTLEFGSDGAVKSSNGSLCGISVGSVANETSTYTIDTLSKKDKFEVKIAKCASTMWYEVNGDILTIYYLCIEGCGEKFKRVK